MTVVDWGPVMKARQIFSCAGDRHWGHKALVKDILVCPFTLGLEIDIFQSDEALMWVIRPLHHCDMQLLANAHACWWAHPLPGGPLLTQPPSSLLLTGHVALPSLFFYFCCPSPLFSVTMSCPITVWLARHSTGQAGSREPQVENCLTGVKMATEMTLIMASQTGRSVSTARMGSNKCWMFAGEGSVKEPSWPRALWLGRCSQPGAQSDNCGTGPQITIDMCRAGGGQHVCLTDRGWLHRAWWLA